MVLLLNFHCLLLPPLCSGFLLGPSFKMWFLLSFLVSRFMPLYASVYLCLVVTCCERADLLALVCGV